MYYNCLLHSKFLHNIKFYQSLEKEGIKFGVMCRTRYGTVVLECGSTIILCDLVDRVDPGPAFS
jgi:hypothetical protein